MAKLFCTQCGAALDEGAKFCTSCGAVVESVAEPVSESAPVAAEPVAEPVVAQAAPVPEREPAMAAAPVSAPSPAQPERPVEPAAQPQPAYQQPVQPQQPPVQRPAAPQAQARPAYQPPVQPPIPPRPAQPAQQPGAPTGRYELMSTWGTFGALLLMSIPGLGLILMIIWACGGCRKYAKRNLARAYLLMLAVCVVVALIALLLMRFVFQAPITEWFEDTFPGYTIDWFF